MKIRRAYGVFEYMYILFLCLFSVSVLIAATGVEAAAVPVVTVDGQTASDTPSQVYLYNIGKLSSAEVYVAGHIGHEVSCCIIACNSCSVCEVFM